MSKAQPLRNDVHPVFQLSNASPLRLVHLIPDELARAVPDHVLFSFSKSTNPRDGFDDVSCRCFANAVNKASWFLAQNLGQPPNFDSVAYVGPNDIRYFILMLAAMKVGYKMVFTSPRNNLDSHLNVLAKSDCHIFLKASDAHTDVESILEKRPMRTFIVPTLAEFLSDTPVDIYPYTKSFDEARHDPCLVLHTTGSTGLPKPIIWKNGMLSTYEAWRTVPHIDGYVPTTEIYQQATRAYTSMPLFHTSGLNAAITWALGLGVTLVYGEPHIPPNAAYVDEMHQYANVDATMGAPSIYEDLCSHPEWLEHLKKMHYVVASGAPLSQKAGSTITRYSRVIGNLGATETANLPRLAPSPEDWEYFYWHPTHSGIELREHGDGLYELFIVRDPKIEVFQGVFYAFPELQEWSMNDLYDRHPEKEFLWRYRCRKDDVIVLNNGEKIAPALIETALVSNPLVRGAMVVGRGQFQPMALIELADGQPPPRDAHGRDDLVERLLPTIGEANKHAPAHAQLDRHHILFADAQRPIHYLGQGKIQRNLTYRLYEDDIAAAYRAVESRLSNGREKPDFFSSGHGETVGWLKGLFAELSSVQLEPGDNFFRAGIDSLQVMRLWRELGGAASQTDIYKHPTLDALAAFLAKEARASPNGSSATAADDDIEEMKSLLASQTVGLPRLGPKQPMTVVLTGSTGSLGSYILDALYRAPHVRRIFCLNRAADGAGRQAQASAGRGLAADWDPGRVAFLRADLSAPFLGLAPAGYQQLADAATHVVHNQWPVNFHWHVASFAPHVRGVRNLADLCLGARGGAGAMLLFVSSVSAVGAWRGSDGRGKGKGEGEGGGGGGGDGRRAEKAVPEDPVFDLSSAAPMGYGRSKLVAERVLAEAAATSGLRAAVCRVGIVAGPVERREGLWNRHEYIPALFNSSAYLGVFPSSFPSRDHIDWLPVDKVAQILFEILDSMPPAPPPTPALETKPAEGGQQLRVYHVTNPQPVSWSDIAPWVTSRISAKPLPFDEWLQRLEASSNYDDDQALQDAADKNPAVKLLDFYRTVGAAGSRPRRLKTKRAAAASRTLREVGPVCEAWVAGWMEQWGLVR